MEWYNKSIEESLSDQNVDAAVGLNDEEVSHRRGVYGENILPEKEPKTIWQKIFEQISDFMIIILIIAAAVSLFVGEYVDSLVIIAIIALNATMGIVQEGKAEKALESLQKMSAPTAKVVRNGVIVSVATADLVPGDIVVLEAGDIVGADMRLIESATLKIDEASLTGESVPAEKKASDVFDGDVGIGDRTNMCFSGSVVSYGRGKGVVVATGERTEIGHIATRISQIEDDLTPLQKNLDKLGKMLGTICLGVCALVFVVGIIRQGISGSNLLDMFMISVSLAVAAIPEGLPAVVTIVLALGMKRMVQRNAIVKRLLAVETLGCVNVICSDKTGTLTQNEMTVSALWAGGKISGVSGTGYTPIGEITDIDGNVEDLTVRSDLRAAICGLALCNDASISPNDVGGYSIVGDPTEAALITLAGKAGLTKAQLNDIFPRVAELPFDSDRKMMTTFHKSTSGLISYTKGAPDIVLERCTHINMYGEIIELNDELRQSVLDVNRAFAGEALRVLAIASRSYKTLPPDVKPETIESEMTFEGLVGMIDPARPEARNAIRTCRSAGIRPVMITGDHKDTAVAIARSLTLMTDGDGVLTGAEVEKLSDEELMEAVKTTAVYARVSPEHKVRIVAALRRNTDIAAMTGDGVNDAPALKEADIGVSMGITGTDVAKGTADMVLTDDNFASIVSAVEEGRIIYANIRKFVYFLLSCNIGEILIVFLAILFNLPTPLTAIQLLWLNLVTDSFPALALGTEKGERDVMKRKPRGAHEPIVDRLMAYGIAVQSVLLTVSVLGIYLLSINVLAPSYGIAAGNVLSYARTMSFTMLISCELLRSFSCRSEHQTIFDIGIATNKTLLYSVAGAFALLLATLYLPFMRPLFDTVPLGFGDWCLIVIGAVLPLVGGELFKKFIRPRISPDGKFIPKAELPVKEKKEKRKLTLVEKLVGDDPTLEDEPEVKKDEVKDEIPEAPDVPDIEEYVEEESAEELELAEEETPAEEESPAQDVPTEE